MCHAEIAAVDRSINDMRRYGRFTEPPGVAATDRLAASGFQAASWLPAWFKVGSWVKVGFKGISARRQNAKAVVTNQFMAFLTKCG